MTFASKPQFQQLIPNLQSRVQAGTNGGPVVGIAGLLVPTLPFDIASQVVKFSDFRHTMVATLDLVVRLPVVPKDETHIYTSLSTSDNGGWQVEVTYPAQGILPRDARFIEFFSSGNRDSLNLLISDNGTQNNISRQARPLKVYPGGILSLLSVGSINIGTDIDFNFLWTVAPGPIQVGAELAVPVITEV